eukprot:Skav200847  [mRNA]  locus=scaffold2131:193836:194396:+ [translate_table: standard]
MNNHIVKPVSEGWGKNSQRLGTLEEWQQEWAGQDLVDTIGEAGVPRPGIGHSSNVLLHDWHQTCFPGSIAHGLCMPQRRHAGARGNVLHVLLVLGIGLVISIRHQDFVGKKSATWLQEPSSLTKDCIQITGVLQGVDPKDFAEARILEVRLVVVALHHLATIFQASLLDALICTHNLFICHGQTSH